MKPLITLAVGLATGLALLCTGLALAQQPLPLEYVAPRPGSELVSARTAIAFRQGEEIDVASIQRSGLITVSGSESGIHGGKTVLADDSQTVLFQPDQPFTPGETVRVVVGNGLKTRRGDSIEGISYQFRVSPRPLLFDTEALETAPYCDEVSGQPVPETTVPERQSEYVTLPGDFPVITVTVPASNTAPGYLFVTNFTGPGLPTAAPYLMILDNQGEPVFYKKQPPNKAATDFKRHPNGLLTYYDRSVGKFQALDQTYATVGIYSAVNHWTNNHDFQLLPNGHQLYLIYDSQTIDMSRIVPGGNPAATVYGLIVQEVDTNRHVVFEWRSWDHIDLTDSNQDLTTQVIDLIHGNAVGLDFDGNLLISSRHLDEVTKINRHTGAIIWRWGGKRNQFTFIGDNRRFSHQHDIRLLPNGHYTLYDNGNGLTPEYSRALEYVLDQTNKTATLVWEYRNTPDVFAEGMGNAQRLPNGNTMIGWGTAVPTLTEVTPDGRKAFELTMDITHQSYRAFRFVWVGRPSWPPALVAVRDDSATRLVTSWNGATEVASYRIYGGVTPNAVTSLIRTVTKTGFETSVDVTAQLDDFCFFRVRPIDRQGQAMTYSNVVAVHGENCRTVFLPLVGK